MNLNLLSSLLNNLYTANLNYKKNLIINYNKLNWEILNILKKENYIDSFYLILNKNFIKIKIILNYKGKWQKKPFISLIKKINLKTYLSYKNLYNNYKILKYNQGLMLLSTTYGILSHKDALNFKIGGKLLFYIE
jgi:small subunit ribosomal protein S8